MYCSSGICACTSSATQINDVCYKSELAFPLFFHFIFEKKHFF